MLCFVYNLLLYKTNHIWKLLVLTSLSNVIKDVGKCAEHLSK